MEQEDREKQIYNTPRNTKVDQVQRAYENYLKYGDDLYFQELIEIIDASCVAMIKNYMRSCRRYEDPRIVQEIQQEAKFAVWKDIKRTRERNASPRYTFYWYARGIYRNCMANENKEFLSTGNIITNTAESLSGLNVEEDYVQAHPLHEKKTAEDDEVLDQERGYFYANFLDAYMHTLMECSEPAENCLAVMYMRILPHVLDLVRDSIMSSAVWARKQIEDKTVAQMTILSEEKMRVNGYPYYNWGQDYIRQLRRRVTIDGECTILKDVEYLKAYDKGRNLEHMDRDTHRIIQREAYKNLIKDPQFISLAKEYVNKSDLMYKLIGGAK